MAMRSFKPGGIPLRPRVEGGVNGSRKYFYRDFLNGTATYGWSAVDAPSYGRHTLAGVYNLGTYDLRARAPNIGTSPTAPNINLDNSNYFYNVTANPGLDSVVLNGDGSASFDMAQGNSPSQSQNCMPALKFSPPTADYAVEYEVRLNPVALGFYLILGGRASTMSGGWANGINFVGAQFDMEFDGGLTVYLCSATSAGFVQTATYIESIDYVWPCAIRFRVEFAGNTRTVFVDGRAVLSDTFSGFTTGDAYIAPLFYQAGSGLHQSKVLSMAVENLFTNIVAETGVATESSAFGRATVVAETGAVTDAQTLTRGFNVTETGAVTDQQSHILAATNNVAEAGTVTSALLSVIPTNVAETGTFTDQQSCAVASNLVETGTASSVLVHSGTFVNNATETGAVTDAQTVGPTQNVLETGRFTDTVANSNTFANNVAETGAVTDAQTITATRVTNVAESGTFTEASANTLTGFNNIIEYAWATDTATGGGAPGAWVAHLETFAMTRYTNFPFESMAVVDGVLVGCGEGGAYRLDASTDAGTNISASIVHDWSDAVAGKDGVVSTPNFKHPRDFYVDGTGGALTLALGYVASGAETSASYTVPAGAASAFATRRVTDGLGRGIRSRYLRPTLSNVSGADFTLNSAKLVVDLANRTV